MGNVCRDTRRDSVIATNHCLKGKNVKAQGGVKRSPVNRFHTTDQGLKARQVKKLAGLLHIQPSQKIILTTTKPR